MASMADLVRQRIRKTGPLRLSDYMALALLHPDYGYYSTRSPSGIGGDFVTAPEISQMFGELLGLWAAAGWEVLGCPEELALVELGPGRGTLMADALRAARHAPAFRRSLRIEMVEASPVLAREQQDRLRDLGDPCPAAWHQNIADLSEGPAIFIANEFFDALPLRQFQKTPAGWAERLVGLAPDGARLAYLLGPPSPAHALLLPEDLRSAPEGEIAEIAPAAQAFAGELGRRLAAAPGLALIIDYGAAESRPGATFQAVRGHRRHDPLEAPGSADLTAHVDFQSLALAARSAGARTWGPVTQGDFLRRLGIEARAAQLTAQNPAAADDIAAALERLTDREEMGELFKVLVLSTPGQATPPGLLEAEESLA